jgi:hypothetical protein
MNLSLYEIIVPTYLQLLGSTAKLLDKAETFCAENNIEPANLIQVRLVENMLPFAYQISSISAHSMGAIEGVRCGFFSPDMTTPNTDIAGLRDIIVKARDYLNGLSADEINALTGKEMCFKIGDYRADYLAERFLLSFSVPNFIFHVTTAYDILRWKGVKLGKTDFLGRVQRIRY